jgi:carboxyl-terminal processing protease
MKHLMVTAVLFAWLLAAPSAGADADTTYEKLDVFAQVLHYVQESYVEDADSKRLLYSAIRGMLKTLDPHTVFMTPEEFKSMQEDTSGHFGGVGIELELRDRQLVVLAPIDDTPAARAGILPGDRIIKIDGDSSENMDVLEASRRIKGVPGTKVVLSIDRDDFEQPKDFILIRQRIRINPIEKDMPIPGYGVLKIRAFTERTERYLMDALGELKTQAGGELKGLVLDLRNNPGGLLDQSVRVADRFISDGVIVETRGRGDKVEKDFAHKQGTEPFYPMIVLINGGSASASEIVAGALQDHARAVIMGTRSFGKGSVQTVVGLKDGSGLKLTIARYYTPKHRSIQEQGIVPDVAVPVRPPELDAEIHITREKDLSGHLKKEKDLPTPESLLEAIGDYQLRTALYYLKVWEKFGRSRLSKKDTH